MFLINNYFILIAVLVIEEVNCKRISCYQCNSNVDADCIDSPAEKYKKLCPDNMNGCRKIYQEMRILEETEILVHRECAFKLDNLACNNGPTPNKIHQIICECNQNNCNGILNKNKLSRILFIFILLIIIMQ